MSNTITAIKLRNLLKAKNPSLVFKLSNDVADGVVLGCSGFITNPETGNIVYVLTEPAVYGPLSEKVLIRTANSTKDYTGGQNQFGLRKNNEYVELIMSLLNRG